MPVNFTAFSNEVLSTVGVAGFATVKNASDVAPSEFNTLLDAVLGVATTSTL